MVELRGPGGLIHGDRSPTLSRLIELLDDQPTPVDEEGNHTFLTPLRLQSLAKSTDAFHHLVDQFMDMSQGKRRSEYRDALRRHWEVVLLNLSFALFQRRWVLVSLDDRAYGQDSELRRMGLSYSAMKTVVDFLSNQRLIKFKRGKLYKGGPKRTRIFPGEQLEPLLWSFFLDAEQPIEPPYVAIKTTNKDWHNLINNPDFSHTDADQMTGINEFLKDHTWACKGPVVLRYTDNVLSGGRLFTPYQNLPDKRVRIRMNTLIDDEPLCEVDFNANHLRLQLAVLAEKDAGEGPYEDICMQAQIFDRDKVKSFITVAMGANDRANAANSLRRNGVTTKEFEVLEAATLKRFPDASLFTAWTHQAQNLEGQILKRVLLQGIEKGVVCLPVHDAVAVQQQHADWAKEAMSDAWEEEVGMGVKPRLKVDYP